MFEKMHEMYVYKTRDPPLIISSSMLSPGEHVKLSHLSSNDGRLWIFLIANALESSVDDDNIKQIYAITLFI